MLHSVTTPASWRYILIVPALLLGAVLSATIVSARPSEQSAHTTPPLTQTPEGCLSGWSVVESPNRDPVGNNKLYDVSVISANDIWAVGYSGQYATGVSTLTMHWDGTEWSIVPSPNPAIGSGILYGVSALSANNVWAVGSGYDGIVTTEILIQHWDGTQWSIMPAPLPVGPATNRNTLNDIEALAPDDIWAVGDDGYLAIIMHWDGAEWQIVSHSAIGRLQGVSAISPNDIWAVGFTGSAQTVTMHWDGTQWTVVPSPNPGQYVNELVSVEAISANDVWAVGAADRTLILHWDGTGWTEVTAPLAVLHDINAVSPNDIWAVGFLPSLPSTGNTITMHWDGTTWSIVPSPSPDPVVNQLWGLAQVSPNEMWAVGCQGGDCINSGRSLIEKYIGSCLTPTASPSHTPQPPTPTPTSVMPTPTCGPAWEIISSPNVTTSNVLHSVAVVSPSDIWAVGVFNDGTRAYTLIEHWNGSSWSIVPSPVVGDGNSLLNAVAAISPTDVWAAGSYTEAGVGRTLALHWDGTVWTHVPTPGTSSTFTALAAVGSDDVWAVGSAGGTPSYSLIQHWDGTQWSIVPSPNPGLIYNELYGVSSVSSTDVWAVGVADPGGVPETLTLHWDGQSWSVIPSPNTGSNGNVLWGVSAVSSNDVWAVGAYGTGPGSVHSITQHWNGTAWSLAPSAVNEENPVLYAVAAASATDIWAVGWSSEESLSRTLIEHWDGSQWNTISSPNGGTSNNALYGVAAVPGANAWAVGVHTSFNTASTLVERYTDPCATPAPTATPSITASNTPLPTASPSHTPTMVSSSPTVTATAAPPSLTPTSLATTPTLTTVVMTTATPTTCAIGFTDVPVESAFYSFVRCLACRGIISGYSDGTFRPNNQVTRGQLAKMVSSAAGFNEPVTGQTFEDLPSTNTFYEWIQRLAARGHIGGYECGGSSEPCISGKPYFRPNANATRGQISKIVSNAAEYNDPPGTQIFEDVPSTHTFYDFIQRLASRGAMSGYPCGGTGEPCLSDKPYFRPQNNATRGQTSKIVSNTFFPECNP